MQLFDYQKEVQRLIRDQNQAWVNPDDLRIYINKSRRQVALRTQCVRILSQPYGGITTATITNPGSGYVNPIATITPPDFPGGALPDPLGVQATATVQQIGGVISNINITNGGDGYFSPAITIADANGPGTGATATLALTPIMQTQNNQEIYSYNQVPTSMFPGVGPVFWVNSMSLIYQSYRYSMMVYSFTTYQSKIRNYPLEYRYVPSVAGQLSTGTTSRVYLYPVAAAPYQMEWDCFCLPTDLIDDQSVEAIPQPWQDVVCWYAAHLAFLELQNLNAAQYYLKLTEQNAHDYSSWARPRHAANPYGRW